MSRGCITLLTDFGPADPYVAAMKGVALGVNPEVLLVDISHEVAPHDIVGAAYLLAWSFAYFPPRTVHVAVVDPGVGSERRILAAEVHGQFLMAPDNGLLSVAIKQSPPTRLISVTNAAYFRHPVSMTFHGRDIFAPVAAHLSLGVDLGQMGRPVHDPILLDEAQPHEVGGALEGTVVHVDRFGNLVTNIPGSAIRDRDTERAARARVRVAGGERLPLVATYSDVAAGAACALVGSTGHVEVSVNGGSAADRFGVARGARVTVQFES